MRSIFLAAALVLFSASVSGASAGVEPEPGLMTAGSPIYGLDIAVDQVLMVTPLMDPGDVAFERASEMVVAQQRNNSEAFEKASSQLNRTVDSADRRHRQGLSKAAGVLESVNASLPAEAQSGIQNALSQVRRAQNRTVEQGLFSEEISPGGLGDESNRSESEAGSDRPDIEVPGG
ncbi:hypothetical protein [Natrinema altunense]|uniref:DUF5667 domain-containing protein n=1 Tax=Natrinema altunense (strain JCM 12890 / CGMCC 1.3731 / AJ2) TaxID=1227494 RepID=L9ZCE4_NATA2|nr:hypothetical protein [Natrinema altunense]ELY83676.1 hypothetical protein C485_18027 [Natrinema altunense JCM 12890]